MKRVPRNPALAIAFSCACHSGLAPEVSDTTPLPDSYTSHDTTSAGDATGTTTKATTSTSTNTNTSAAAGTSSTTAAEPFCGDGVVDEGEECDDGKNGDQDDGCTDECRHPACGDGYVQKELNEQCDDGNDDDNDACLNSCLKATCGDGVVQEGVEDCDDGNTNNSDSCLANCAHATCGDGFIQTGIEECDDWTDNGDGNRCSIQCHRERFLFVTSALFQGNLATDDIPPQLARPGLPLADAYCQYLAEHAFPSWKASEFDGVFVEGFNGAYRAWLSDSQSSPSTRFFENGGLPQGFSGRFVALDGSIVASGWQDLTDGTLQNPLNVDEAKAIQNHAVWTGTNPDGTASDNNCDDWTSTGMIVAGMGDSSTTDPAWTLAVEDNLCGNFDRLYCFQVSLEEP